MRIGGGGGEVSGFYVGGHRFGQLGDCWGIGIFWLRGIKIFFLVEFGNWGKGKILFRFGEVFGGLYKYI